MTLTSAKLLGDGATGLAFMEALWAGDLPACFAMMSADARWYFQLGMPQAHLGRGRVWPAREALQRIVDDLFGKFDARGFTVTASRVTASGGAVAIEYEANGHTATGKVYQNYYVTILTIVGGQVTEIRPHNDTAHMLRLIG
jgi:ketosteroid isomerase-like protein